MIPDLPRSISGWLKPEWLSRRRHTRHQSAPLQQIGRELAQVWIEDGLETVSFTRGRLVAGIAEQPVACRRQVRPSGFLRRRVEGAVDHRRLRGLPRLEFARKVGHATGWHTHAPANCPRQH